MLLYAKVTVGLVPYKEPAFANILYALVPTGLPVPEGAAVLEAVSVVIVEPVASEPVPVATKTGASKGKVRVKDPPGVLNLMFPDILLVAEPVRPA